MVEMDEVNDGVIRRTSFVIKMEPKEPMSFLGKSSQKALKSPMYLFYRDILYQILYRCYTDIIPMLFRHNIHPLFLVPFRFVYLPFLIYAVFFSPVLKKYC